ncbi:MAG TPA: aminotransferase class I/II-fold pyridoxal phosphate-dependent enzyme [Micromonosporaceae bacterium]
MPVRYQPRGSTASEISASVEAALRTGGLDAGDPLPPVRALAADLGVSPATVAAAYQALRQRGVVVTSGRNGTRIRPRPAVIGTRGAWRMAVPDGALDLLSGEPDPRLLPVLSLDRASDRPLPDLAAEMFARDGLDLTGAAIGVTSGALDAIERVLGAHLRPGDRIAIEDPGWAGALDLVAALGLDAVPMAVDDEGPTVAGLTAALAAGARAVVVTSRAQNPTGAAVTRARALALRSVLAARPEVLVIEDDHAAQLSDVDLHPLAGAVPRWAFVRSVSKPYGPDLRLAVVAGDSETIGRLEGRQRLGAGWVSSILQRVVAGLWTSPEVDALIVRARDSYRVRRTMLLDALLARGLAATGRTGINVWVPVPDETAAVARLRSDGYAVAPGSLFRQATGPAIRITVSQLGPQDIEPLADAVARAARPESLRQSWS